MKSFITGFKGQLGYDLAKELYKRGENEIIVSDRGELDKEINKRSLSLMNEEKLNYSSLDITDKEAVINLIKKVKPDVIFHCAAWTNVDAAEDNYDACYNVNVIGTKNLTEAAKEVAFTDRQKQLAQRKEVTKSLIVACTKIVDFNNISDVIERWVGKDTDKFLKVIPLITVNYKKCLVH